MWTAVLLSSCLVLLAGEAIHPLLPLAARRRTATADAGPDTPPAPSTADGREPVPDLSRRLFVSRSTAVAADAVAAMTVGHGARTGLAPPRLKRITVDGTWERAFITSIAPGRCR